MANKDDNPTFKEAITGPDVGGFITAMEAEIAEDSINDWVPCEVFVMYYVSQTDWHSDVLCFLTLIKDNAQSM
jgi:hypothetical protein